MAFIGYATTLSRGGPSLVIAPATARALLCGVMVAAGLASILLPDAQAGAAAVTAAGDDLTRLLRFMAAIKAVLALGAAVGVLWRLGVGVPLRWALAYGAACGAMAAGPGLIWGMAHVGLGALLLHGGLLATGVLLWRDPAVSSRLATSLKARRTGSRARG